MLYLDKWIEDETGGELEQYQLSHLKKVLSYASKRSNFYRDLANYDIKNLDDISKIPFTYPENLIKEPYKFLCVPLGKIKRAFTLYSSGTTGIPKKVFFTPGDIDRITDWMGIASKTVAKSASLSERYKVIQLLPDTKPWSQAKLSEEAARKVKAVAITVEPALDAQTLTKLIKEYKPDILFGTPTKIYRITQQYKEQHDLNKLGVKVLYLSSEYTPKAMEARLRAFWGCEVYHYYGMTEAGFMGGVDCHDHNVFHFNELDLLLEVIDPQTKEPLKEGEGELIFTTLRREAMPLIRYRTRDLVELIPGKCPCGTCLKSLGRAIKRAEPIERLGTEEVSLIDFDEAMYAVPQVIDYQVAFDKRGKRTRVIVRVEVTQKKKEVGKLISDALMQMAQIKGNVVAGRIDKPEIEIVDSIKREGRAKKTIQHL
jgi:phenylacetate-coenzyme A ligase PaaK-like adenylate-forming protein